jgi:hypothetical protein
MSASGRSETQSFSLVRPAAREAAGAAARELRSAAVTTAAEHIVPQLVQEFSARHPELTVTLDVGSREREFLDFVTSAAAKHLVERSESPKRARQGFFGARRPNDFAYRGSCLRGGGGGLAIGSVLAPVLAGGTRAGAAEGDRGASRHHVVEDQQLDER